MCTCPSFKWGWGRTKLLRTGLKPNSELSWILSRRRGCKGRRNFDHVGCRLKFWGRNVIKEKLPRVFDVTTSSVLLSHQFYAKITTNFKKNLNPRWRKTAANPKPQIWATQTSKIVINKQKAPRICSKREKKFLGKFR